MLPAQHRIRDAGQYRAVLRDRRAGRAGGSLLAVHVIDADAFGLSPEDRVGPRVGFVVSKAVGNAVVRSRAKRVLRHVARDALSEIDPGLDIVVRANPAIAGASSHDVAREFDRILAKATRRQRPQDVSRETDSREPSDRAHQDASRVRR